MIWKSPRSIVVSTILYFFIYSYGPQKIKDNKYINMLYYYFQYLSMTRETYEKGLKKPNVIGGGGGGKSPRPKKSLAQSGHAYYRPIYLNRKGEKNYIRL